MTTDDRRPTTDDRPFGCAQGRLTTDDRRPTTDQSEIRNQRSGIRNGGLVVDWASTIYGVMHDVYCGVPVATISARFHNTLTEMIVEVARLGGERQVALTGGCFQNAYLLERTAKRLREEGFYPYWHQRVPPNDGGIALGQIMAIERSKQ